MANELQQRLTDMVTEESLVEEVLDQKLKAVQNHAEAAGAVQRFQGMVH
jgi:hypothetical protein